MCRVERRNDDSTLGVVIIYGNDKVLIFLAMRNRLPIQPLRSHDNMARSQQCWVYPCQRKSWYCFCVLDSIDYHGQGTMSIDKHS